MPESTRLLGGLSPPQPLINSAHVRAFKILETYDIVFSLFFLIIMFSAILVDKDDQ